MANCYFGDPLTDYLNAPVICVSGPKGAGDTGDIAGLKC